MSLQIQAVVPPPDVYTVEGFGRAFQCSKSFIFNEIAAGRLRAVKAGRKTFILRADALAYLNRLPQITSAEELDRTDHDPAEAPADRLTPNEIPERYRPKPPLSSGTRTARHLAAALITGHE